MAVRAAHLTQSDLGLDARPRCPSRDQGTDQLVLLADMVEVQDPYILLAAVDARMVLEVRDELGPGRPCPPAARDGRLLDVLCAAAPEVLAEAVATPVLKSASGAVER